MELSRYLPRAPERHYVAGESHWYLGRQYRLRIAPATTPSVRLGRTEMFVGLRAHNSPDRIRTILDGWYRERARREFGSLLERWLERTTLSGTPTLVVRTMRTRWGSLSPAGRMSLNLRLVRAPRRCIEYVIVHELCHLQHRGHDAAFFRQLGRFLPDWERQKRLLESLPI